METSNAGLASTVGRTFRLWGGRFDYGWDVLNAGRRFGCGADDLTMGWTI